MTISMERLEQHLQAWTYWVLKNQDNKLGFPKCSIYANMTRVSFQAGSLPYYIPTYEEAERMEGYIKELAERHLHLAKALRLFYCEVGSLALKAKRLGSSCTQFKTDINLARYWLAGRMRL